MGEVRFGVESRDGKRRSSTWKVWSPRKTNDVYIACRTIGAFKASLHQSGHCHIGFAPKFVADQAPHGSRLRTDRYASRWTQPVDSLGIVLAIRIVLPHSSVSIPQKTPRDAIVVWLAEPAQGTAVTIAVLLAPPSWKAAGNPVGHYDLGNGSRVWVRYACAAWTPPKPSTFSGASVTRFAEGANVDLATEGDLRAIVVV